MESLNLCDYPWIPIAGKKERKSLMQIFSEPDLSQLSGNPVDKIVILRFLLCIVHASSPILDNAAWQDLTTAKMAENAKKYLQEHHDCFDLYGEKPFLQFPKLAEIGGEASPVSSLMVSVSEGNKVVFSDWNRFHGISPAETIVLLLRTSGYGCGGKKYDKSLILSPGVEKSASASGGPLLGFMGYLHSYLLGENLLDTLRLNLLTNEEIAETGAFSTGLGTPFWEKMPQGENDPVAQSYRRSYLGELCPLNKFMLLKDNGIIKTDGISYPTLKDGLTDPALTFSGSGKDTKAIWAKTEVHPWRELPALLAFLETTGAKKQPYFLSMGFHKLRKNPPKTIRIWTGGMAVSSNAGEQYLSGTNDYVESSFSFETSYLEEKNFTTYKELMLALNNESKRLYSSVNNYYKLLNSDACSDQAKKAAGIFWDQLDSHAQPILDLAFAETDEEKIQQEKHSWFRILCQIFNDLCPHETPRQMEAWVNTHPEFQNKKTKKEKK